MRQQSVYRSGVWFLTVCLLGATTAGAIAQKAQNTPQKAAPQRIGPFRVKFGPDGTADFSINSKQRMISWDLKGKPLTVTTARYDMSAPHIVLLHNYSRNIVVKANATGGVRIEAREPDLTTVVTCDTAIYREATGANEPTRIDVQGNVRTVVRNSHFTNEDPPVLVAKSGYILFPEGEETSVHLDAPEVSGTPIEPAPKPNKP